VFTFEVTNTGNGPEAVMLEADPAIAGNDFDAIIDAIAVDGNGNGVYDAGIDPELTAPAVTALIEADASLTIFVLASFPAGVADGDRSEVSLVARAATGTGNPGTSFAGAGANGSDAVVGAAGGTGAASVIMVAAVTSVNLVKSAAISDPFGGTSPVPGATITYTILAEVSGSGAVENLVISDPVPQGSQYAPNSIALDGVSLTDAPGDDAAEADASGILVSLGTVPAGTSSTITFDVIINQ
jgi:uncharacterized repeat protein (TIGR01451 family)